MKNVIGKFGHDEVKSFICTIGLNEKGGMDEEDFKKYIFINIYLLYSETKDVPGKPRMAVTRFCYRENDGNLPLKSVIPGITPKFTFRETQCATMTDFGTYFTKVSKKSH